ncbi:type VI secretion system tip protein VgrG [Kaistella antarctica]|uniref:Phage protein D n=1 Tax=Kaistella antarctica TaxID=266748 RepID=A0A3S4VEJ1_9FLAO|nr:type VI secretion system tip protein VgrG [Kaistella antarctica]KEY19077.1 hypothetical protein HY04_11630 [Kaistella antarctica]SEW11873.1 Rhs element Vgr protein [Kaistella antarctica]VEH98929.1 Phage protein D [Kaistella antarctica]
MPENKSKPSLSILRNDIEISSKLIYSVSVEFAFSTIPKATILINDQNLEHQFFGESEKEEWQIGERIDLRFGYNQQFDLIFSGVIIKQGIRSSGTEHYKLYLELRHRYYLSSLKKSSRVFNDKRDSEAIEEIMTDYGFKKEIDVTNGYQSQLIQFNSTDWNFINLRAQANNRYVIPRNDLFLVKNINSLSAEKAQLVFGPDILKLNLETDSRFSFETFSTITWDVNNQEVAEYESSKNTPSTAGIISSVQIAEKSKHGKEDFLGLGSLSEIEATNLSDLYHGNAELSKIRGMIKCTGNNAVVIGDWIILEGVGKQFSGKLLVSGIIHELSATEWFTTYQIGTDPQDYANQNDDSFKKPTTELLPGINGLQIGIVTKITSDDEKILVELPHLNQGVGSVWARSARMEAGHERGWIFRPEIGDEVILGFINDDPRQAIILGSLHSAKNAAPIVAEDENNLKGYISKENLKLLFDDEHRIISILTPTATIQLDDNAGKITLRNEENLVEISADGIKMETQKDIKLKAAGNIDLEGINITLIANTELTVEGKRSTKVTSAGSTVIKGTIVQIN